MEEEESNDGDADVELVPGDEVTLYFKIENLFDRDIGDGDMEITITAELDDSDFGEDIDEDEDFNLDAGEEVDEGDDSPVLEPGDHGNDEPGWQGKYRPRASVTALSPL